MSRGATPLELWVAGTVLRTARAYARLSQRELAERTGFAQSTIARIEAGRARAHWTVMIRCLRECGLRFALVAEDGEVIDHAPLVTARDAAGRRYPSHLKVRRVEKPEQWWNGGGRQPRVVPLSDCPPFTYRQRRWWDPPSAGGGADPFDADPFDAA